MKKLEEFPIKVKAGSVSAKIYRTPTGNGYNSFTLAYWQDKTRKREAFGDLAEAKKELEAEDEGRTADRAAAPEPIGGS